MLMPKKVKHRKQMRGRMTGVATRGSEISFGEYGLKCLEPAWITDRQIEAARIAMTRHIKRGGKIWIRMFPDKPVTKKPAETRMGKGKGARSIGWPSLNPAGFFTRSKVWTRRRRATRCVWPRRSFPSRRSLLPARIKREARFSHEAARRIRQDIRIFRTTN